MAQPEPGSDGCSAALKEDEWKALRGHDDEGSLGLRVASTVAPTAWTRGAWWKSLPLGRRGCHETFLHG